MNIFLSGLIIFFGIHSVAIINASWRDRMVAKLGKYGWKGLYSLLAIAGLTLLVWGYTLVRAQPVIIFNPAPWLHYISLVLLVPVFPLLVATYYPGRIHAWVRHPMLVATILWAAAHLLVNGTLPAVILFSAFLVWAVADLVSLKHRNTPDVPAIPASPRNDAIAIIAGLALYALFITHLHSWLFGVPAIAV
jgi:uncharacterized membrane protein